MAADRFEAKMNLEELQGQLTGRVALVTLVLSGSVAALIIIQRPFPVQWFGVMAALAVLGSGVWNLRDRYPSLARHMLVWGLTGALLAAMGVLSVPWLPFLGLSLPFVSAFLVPGGEFAIGVAITGLAFGLVHIGSREYLLYGLLVGIGLSVVLSWLVARTLYTALGWAWTMQERADRLLEVARQRQGELSRALNSLDKTNWILRRVQRELISARAEAEEARALKERFAANVSHELRTPLNLVLGFSQIMYLLEGLGPALRVAYHGRANRADCDVAIGREGRCCGHVRRGGRESGCGTALGPSLCTATSGAAQGAPAYRGDIRSVDRRRSLRRR